MDDSDRHLTATLAIVWGTTVAIAATLASPNAPDALLGLIIECGTLLTVKLVILGE